MPTVSPTPAAPSKDFDGKTLTLTPSVVLDMRADELGKLIQSGVRTGLAIVRIEELATIAERLGIPLSELSGTAA